MKNTFRITAALALVTITLLPGCKKNIEIEHNKLIIAGNSTDEYNCSIVPEGCYFFPEDIIPCNPDLYKNELLLAFTTGEVMYIEIYKAASSSAIPVGSFPNAGQCETGNISYFYFATDKKYGGLIFSDGTVTITKDGDVYDLDIDMTFSNISGGGTIKGNYHGSMQSPPAK